MLLSQDSILTHADKLIFVPYDRISERVFRDTYIDEGELYLFADGILGIPFTVDPLVMYWKRDMLSGAAIASPPKFWDELFEMAPKVVVRDKANNITKSFTALGEYQNVTNAKETLITLIMQAGNPIVSFGERGLDAVLSDNRGFATSPAEAALRFYTEFSNPVKSVYSWNRALPSSRQSFIGGDLALYFGFASELASLRRANPNLNFDVTVLPQSRDSSVRTTFGRMSAFAIPRTSRDPVSALTVASVLSSAPVLSSLSQASLLPPVRRDVLAIKQTDAFLTVFYDSALMSRAWLDPAPAETGAVFQRMVENTVSGKLRLNEAVRNAHAELQGILQKGQ